MISEELQAADHLCEMINHVWLTSKDKMAYKTAIKCLRESDKAYKQGRADAIEEFVRKYENNDCPYSNEKCERMPNCVVCIAEQLKEQSK